MPDILSTQLWDFIEGVTLCLFSAMAAIALSRCGTSHLLNLLFTNLPVVIMLALSLLRETFENRRWR
jgi:hypothetical protein